MIIVAILRAGHYVDVSGAAEHATGIAQANYWFNVIIRWVFITVGVATIWDVLNELWKMMKSRRTGALAL